MKKLAAAMLFLSSMSLGNANAMDGGHGRGGPHGDRGYHEGYHGGGHRGYYYHGECRGGYYAGPRFCGPRAYVPVLPPVYVPVLPPLIPGGVYLNYRYPY
jgi:hypothetical protein